jgi:cystathionine beta-lyase/cystathionine gamma-synthase
LYGSNLAVTYPSEFVDDTEIFGYSLAFAYTMCAYANKLNWAAEYGLKPTQIRISAGLENISTLFEEFRIAV